GWPARHGRSKRRSGLTEYLDITKSNRINALSARPFPLPLRSAVLVGEQRGGQYCNRRFCGYTITQRADGHHVDERKINRWQHEEYLCRAGKFPPPQTQQASYEERHTINSTGETVSPVAILVAERNRAPGAQRLANRKLSRPPRMRANVRVS